MAVQGNAIQELKCCGPFYFSNTLFRNKRLKQKRLKWALKISKTTNDSKYHNISANGQKTYYRSYKKNSLPTMPPEVTIDLLSDDEHENKPNQNHFGLKPEPEPYALPQLVVFPAHMQISQSPNITLIPVHPLSIELAASLQNRVKRKRKSQKPKRLAEPTIVNKESIVLSDDSNDVDTANEVPAACSTPNHFDANHTPNHNNHQVCPAHSAAIPPRIAQVDEEVTVSLVPRCSAAGSCSSKASNSHEIFAMAPDETTVQTIIANRIYELSLSKLREGLATSGAGDFADEQKTQNTQFARRTTFNVPTKLQQQPVSQPVSLKLSSDLSISLISDDEDDPQQQHVNAEKLLRQQPHLSVRPVGLVTSSNRPPKRRKLG